MDGVIGDVDSRLSGGAFLLRVDWKCLRSIARISDMRLYGELAISCR